MATDLLRVMSHGGGVQTSMLALLYATGGVQISGEVQRLDAAIFSDTMEETDEVYEYLDWVEQEVQRCVYPFPIYRVSRGKLWDSATRVRTTRDGQRTYIETAVPAFTVTGLRKGMGQRHCTRDFKIVMVERKLRELLQRSRVMPNAGVLVELALGISTDEADRMKPSRQEWIRTTWPLITAGFSREDCKAWMRARGYPPAPRSACIGCPFHSDEEWLALSPQNFQRAIGAEQDLQAAWSQASAVEGVPYLHESRIPLAEVVFKKGRAERALSNECTGMCGV